METWSGTESESKLAGEAEISLAEAQHKAAAQMTQHFLAQQHRVHCKTVSSLQAQVDEKSPVVPGLVLVEHEQEVVDTSGGFSAGC
jgi:hypothetical protein